MITDESIAALYAARDEEAIRLTQEKYRGLMFSVARNLTGDPSIAEECVADALYAAWNGIPPAPQSLPAFLVRLVRRRSIDRLRERDSQKRGGGELPLIIDELDECVPDRIRSGFTDDIAFKEIVSRFTESLGHAERQLFIGRYFCSLSVAELAEMHGLSRGAVKMRLARTRKKLRETLNKECITI
jgi:RNA polymerase sigma-70 factor (ECF subfamily)